MKGLVVHDFVRLLAMAGGICVLLLTADILLDGRHHGRTDAVVQVRSVVEHDRTKLRASATYLHSNGQRYGFEVPPGYRNGDIIHVRFDRRYPKSVMVESVETVWAVPVIFGVVGVALIAFVLFSKSRTRDALAKPHENLVQQSRCTERRDDTSI